MRVVLSLRIDEDDGRPGPDYMIVSWDDDDPKASGKSTVQLRPGVAIELVLSVEKKIVIERYTTT